MADVRGGRFHRQIFFRDSPSRCSGFIEKPVAFADAVLPAASEIATIQMISKPYQTVQLVEHRESGSIRSELWMFEEASLGWEKRSPRSISLI